MSSVEIYFSDLNEAAQKELLKAVGATDPKEMNWDTDVLPLAILDFETAENEDETTSRQGRISYCNGKGSYRRIKFCYRR